MENSWKKTDERNVLEVKEKAGVTYLSYPLLEHTECVRHAFSTRLGGVSEGIYASMNLSFSRGDDPEAVRENFRRMAEVLEISPEQYVFYDKCAGSNKRRCRKGMCYGMPGRIYRCGRTCDKRARTLPFYFLCRLRAAFFRGSGKKSDRSQPFRLERNGRKDRESDGGENDGTVRDRSKGCRGGSRAVYLPGLL